VAAQGFVLLQNDDGFLPLSDTKKLNLFGWAASDPAYGGTGSGGMKTDKAQTLKDALEQDGFTVNPTLWAFYREGAGKDYGQKSAAGSLNNYIFKNEEFAVNEAPLSAFSAAEWDSVSQYGDAAIMVIGRVCGEGKDLPVVGASDANGNMLSISAEEKDILRKLAELKAAGNISQQVYDQTKAQYDQLVETERFQNENTFVKAQFNGVVSAKNYEDGEMYTGAPILTLTQISRLKALINVPESYFPLVKQGMKLDIVSEIYPNQTFPATIEIVYPTVDPNTHTFQCKLNIPNGGEKIRPGMYVKTKLALGEVDAIVVPYQSVLKLTGSNDRYVFTYKDGEAHRVAVTLGQRYDDRIEIIPMQPGELKEGDQIVVTGMGRLVDGSPLEIVTDSL
jgi:RND family efflux transporter MFP subunit